MSATATGYVRRHVVARLSRPQAAVLYTIADVADLNGRARVTQPMLAEDLGCSVKTVEKHMRCLLRPAAGDAVLVKGGGRTYVIIGVAEHEVRSCLHPECAAEAAADYLAVRRRAKTAAERAAAYRARRAARTA